MSPLTALPVSPSLEVSVRVRRGARQLSALRSSACFELHGGRSIWVCLTENVNCLY
ncbi:uncharacterized protein LACBIDRAFT_299351 [Laccaria bicolor S238N-H82]|uniref:Predicted protein n=1 Tax=Laccaria bicolor (strain S238N-H82 / ATCC MYA-4686) TaxID=486041 RepID=B0DEK0_LACBS|nr:uncharacterized protein LACBIDRAFT_299351 [Laccaria bicolor S238N-H82]EDR06947.1 predicted protein [Laccaria bicolor S238N-H82]|eukprot:XP_001882320.1 predicted protein [Laccaria bicolor S238N-H82]